MTTMYASLLISLALSVTPLDQDVRKPHQDEHVLYFTAPWGWPVAQMNWVIDFPNVQEAIAQYGSYQRLNIATNGVLAERYDVPWDEVPCIVIVDRHGKLLRSLYGVHPTDYVIEFLKGKP